MPLNAQPNEETYFTPGPRNCHKTPQTLPRGSNAGQGRVYFKFKHAASPLSEKLTQLVFFSKETLGHCASGADYR